MRSTMLLITVLLLALPACGDEPAPAGDDDRPAAGDATSGAKDDGKPKKPRPRLLLCQELMSTVMGGPPVRILVLVLLPDGTVVWDVPPGGIDKPDLARLRKEKPDNLGTWKLAGKTLHLTWPREPEDSRHWTLPRDGKGYRRNAQQLFVPVSQIEGPTIVGTWVSEASAKAAGESGVIVGREARLVLEKDGKFERGAKSGIAGDEAVGYRESSDRGRWSLTGFTLVLRPEGGKEERLVAYRWPGAPNDLGIGKGRYTKR